MPPRPGPLDIEIESLGYQGEGVGRLEDGRVVFVPFALGGERVRARLVQQKKSHATARLVEVLRPSPDRVAPPCPVFGRCGGCASQHMGYTAELAFKREAVANNLQKIARLDTPVPPVAGMNSPWRYRNKTTWQIHQQDGQPQAGFFAAGSHQLVRTDDCLIAHPASARARHALLDWMTAHRIEGYEPAGGTGLVRQLITRVNEQNQMMVLLVLTRDRLPQTDDLLSRLRAVLPGLVSVCSISAPRAEDENRPRPVACLMGKPCLDMDLEGLRLRLSPTSFYQVNHHITRLLYHHVIQQAVRRPEDVVIDIYSGVGTMSLLAARAAGQVYGLELSPQAVADARHNARVNDLDHVRFIQGAAETELPGLVQSGVRADAIILDPPRQGAHPRVLAAIAQARPRRLVYISCHPATQARDARALAQAGYLPVSSQAFDMFCKTSRVEHVLTFTRSEL